MVHCLVGEEMLIPDYQSRSHTVGVCTKTLMAWVYNSDGRAALIADMVERCADVGSLCERFMTSNDLENFFGCIVRRLGWKAPAWRQMAAAKSLDRAASLRARAPQFRFACVTSARKRWDVKSETARRREMWNNGQALIREEIRARRRISEVQRQRRAVEGHFFTVRRANTFFSSKRMKHEMTER